MIDNNFSILLVLKDRPSYTFRYMKYMDLLNFPYKILIADGGENVEIQQVLENKDNFPKKYLLLQSQLWIMMILY